MTKRFIDIKIGDKLYEAYRYQPICENISVSTVVNITNEGSHHGPTFMLYSNEKGKYSFPVFNDELEIGHITLADRILATSLETLKQAIFKDIAEDNKKRKISFIYGSYKI